mgnify:CR=1 FL=1|tara:strand:+ start:47 stop:982 length:936 start_codon:yes stop_codon:yes gene_type:complete
MDLQYLKFKGFNLTNQVGVRSFVDEGGETAFADGCFPVIENTRTLQIDKDDIYNIYGYEPEIYAINGSNFGTNLSYRIVLDLESKGLVEVQIVSEVPVNAINENANQAGSIDDTFLTTQDSGLSALTVPFQAFLSRDLGGIGLDTTENLCVNGNGCDPINDYFDTIQKSGATVPVINGKQYQWTKDAILAYFGIFTTQTGSPLAGPNVSVRETVLSWLEEKVSKHLVGNPGSPVTDVELGEVKDFVYNGVTYGGFKLRFGGLGNYCPTESSASRYNWCTLYAGQPGCDKGAITSSLPFRYLDRYLHYNAEA